MNKVVSGVCIVDNALLLVRKRKTWILPGGKIEPDLDKDQESCLKRECLEEMQANVIPKGFLGNYRGITPHSRNKVMVSAWFMNVLSNPFASSEIKEARFFKADELSGLTVSDVTQKVCTKLFKDGLLRKLPL